MDEDNRITVTVTDNERDPQEDVTVIVKGDLGQRETGETDEDGNSRFPPSPKPNITGPILSATQTAPSARSAA